MPIAFVLAVAGLVLPSTSPTRAHAPVRATAVMATSHEYAKMLDLLNQWDEDGALPLIDFPCASVRKLTCIDAARGGRGR